jgi:hypothetical protein
MDNTNNEWIALGLKAEACILSGNIDSAKEYLLQSISLGPNRPWPYFLLASITEDNDEAIDLIRATKHIKVTEWYYINLI